MTNSQIMTNRRQPLYPSGEPPAWLTILMTCMTVKPTSSAVSSQPQHTKGTATTKEKSLHPTQKPQKSSTRKITKTEKRVKETRVKWKKAIATIKTKQLGPIKKITGNLQATRVDNTDAADNIDFK